MISRSGRATVSCLADVHAKSMRQIRKWIWRWGTRSTAKRDAVTTRMQGCKVVRPWRVRGRLAVKHVCLYRASYTISVPSRRRWRSNALPDFDSAPLPSCTRLPQISQRPPRLAARGLAHRQISSRSDCLSMIAPQSLQQKMRLCPARPNCALCCVAATHLRQ